MIYKLSKLDLRVLFINLIYPKFNDYTNFYCLEFDKFR